MPSIPVTSTVTPVSSAVSLTAHCATVSPSSCFPIGIAHCPVSRRRCSTDLRGEGAAEAFLPVAGGHGVAGRVAEAQPHLHAPRGGHVTQSAGRAGTLPGLP